MGESRTADDMVCELWSEIEHCYSYLKPPLAVVAMACRMAGVRIRVPSLPCPRERVTFRVASDFVGCGCVPALCGGGEQAPSHRKCERPPSAQDVIDLLDSPDRNLPSLPNSGGPAPPHRRNAHAQFSSWPLLQLLGVEYSTHSQLPVFLVRVP